jgi:hypothetical protein
MMTTRLLKRSVPVAVMGTALGLLGVSSGDNRDDDKDHDKDHDKDRDLKCDKRHDNDHDKICFNMVRSPGAVAAKCLPHARARVTVKSLGPVEVMNVEVSGLRPNTEFDFFVIEVPNAPFGMSWYQGDIETDAYGRGSGVFVGRFNIETFIVSPAPQGQQKSPVPPQTHTDGPFPDAMTTPATAPIHTYHLGLWFNSPEEAAKVGCPANVTPFNGEHNAGIQILNTGTFKDQEGPLRDLQP